MEPYRTRGAIAAAAVAAAGIAAAALLGAPVAAALAALLAGIAAFALASRPDTTPLAAPVPPEPDEPAGPSAAELLDALGDPLLVVRERRVLAANAAARALLGAHIVGADARLALRHPAAAERLDEGGPAADSGPVELVGLGEPDQHWRMSVEPLPGGGRLVRLADLSAARAAERMRTDFVANASHELRTPLATLLGFIETLQDEASIDPAARARFLGIMAREAARMRELLDDLMSLSRIEADRFSPPREAVDLAALAESVRSALLPLARERGNDIVVENGAAAAMVAGDRAQLSQLLANLVTNAIRYGREGSPVTIRLAESGAASLLVEVVDRGEGIAPEHIPRLTERFYRVDPGRSRSVGGTGLGLAIAKHIALRHRGRLEIASRSGEGTNVRLYLPRLEGADPVT